MRPVRSLSEASVKSSGFGRLSNCTGCCLWHALTSSAARVWLIVDALRRLGSPSPAVSRYLHAPPPPRPPNRMSVRYATTARDRIQIFRAAKRGRIPPSNLAAFLCYATSAECRGENIEMRSRKLKVDRDALEAAEAPVLRCRFAKLIRRLIEGLDHFTVTVSACCLCQHHGLVHVMPLL